MTRWHSLGIAGAALAAVLALTSPRAADFDCSLGDKVNADLGEGVTMHSCSWEKTPGTFVRTGPLYLLRNDILILELRTDRGGILQGAYRSWNDAGVLTESGQYDDGLKEGEWRSIDALGNLRIVVFRTGKPVATSK